MNLYKYLFFFASIGYVGGSEPMDVFLPWETMAEPLSQEQIAAAATLKEAMSLIVSSYPERSMLRLLATPAEYAPFITSLHKLAAPEPESAQIMEDVIYANLSWRQVTYRHHPLVTPIERPYLGDTPYEHNVKQFIAKVIDPNYKVLTYEALVKQKKRAIVDDLDVRLKQFEAQEGSYESFFNYFKESSSYLKPKQITNIIIGTFEVFKHRESSLELAKQAESFILYIKEKNLLPQDQYEHYLEFTVMFFMGIKELPTHIKLAEALGLICQRDHIHIFADYLKMIISRDARFKNDRFFNEECTGE